MSKETSIILVKEEPRGPSQLIEIPFTQNGIQKVNLPDVQQLRSTADLRIILKAMRLVPLPVLDKGVITGYDNAPLSELQKMVLVIYCEGWEKAQYIPLLELLDMRTPDGAGDFWPNRYNTTRFADWQNVDYPKSYIQYVNGESVAGQPFCVMLEVEYERFNAQWKRIEQGANP